MNLYFQKHNDSGDFDADEMDNLTKMLPGNIKIRLLRFRNREILEKVPFLKKRSTTFLLTYLEKLKEMHFEKDEIVAARGSRTSEILFCIKGDLWNRHTNRIVP